MGTLSMNLPHLSQAAQISTGIENLKPKNPIIITIIWNPEFYTLGTNPQNNNSPPPPPSQRYVEQPGLSFSLGVFLHRRGVYKVFP